VRVREIIETWRLGTAAGRRCPYGGVQAVTTEHRPLPSCLVLRKELHECGARHAQNGVLAALVGPGRPAFPAEIKYTRPAFKKAYDLLRANLQPLRDFGRRKIFPQFGEARC
jgi:hypothetical protein